VKRVVVLDYGSGNLRSAERALARVGADVEVTGDSRAALAADGLVVPGVGAFGACLAGLAAVGAPVMLAERIATAAPVFGICVGMQVLFDAGVEHGVETEGLHAIPGRVERLCAPVLPHMGWNTVRAEPGSRMFAGLSPETRYYFVHSYAAHSAPALAHTAVHGEPFVAAYEGERLWATQFHPEKSGDAGAVLLQNWLVTL
jgi:imidazole glycerol-phosphate synthase subunit HisH